MTERDWAFYKSKPVTITARRMFEPFKVKTLEGEMQGNAGDWLIIGTEGEKYPCKDSVFKKKYRFLNKALYVEDSK